MASTPKSFTADTPASFVEDAPASFAEDAVGQPGVLARAAGVVLGGAKSVWDATPAPIRKGLKFGFSALPGPQAFSEDLTEKVGSTLRAAGETWKMPEPATPEAPTDVHTSARAGLVGAAGAATRSLIPAPSERMGKAITATAVPVAPVEYALGVLGPLLRSIAPAFKVARGAKLGQIATKASTEAVVDAKVAARASQSTSLRGIVDLSRDLDSLKSQRAEFDAQWRSQLDEFNAYAAKEYDALPDRSPEYTAKKVEELAAEKRNLYSRMSVERQQFGKSMDAKEAQLTMRLNETRKTLKDSMAILRGAPESQFPAVAAAREKGLPPVHPLVKDLGVEPIPTPAPAAAVIQGLEKSKVGLVGVDDLNRAAGQSQTAASAIVDSAIKAVRSGVHIGEAKGLQVVDQIAQGFASGDLPGEEAARLLGMEADKLTDAGELGAQVKAMFSNYGRGLYEASRFRRTLNEMAKTNPKLAKLIEAVPEVQKHGIDGFMDLFARVETTRRILLTTQLATAARNAISQTGYYALHVVNDMASAIQGAATEKVGLNKAWEIGTAHLINAWQAMKPGQQAKMLSVLDSMPIERAKLLGSPVFEVSFGSGPMRFLSLPNTLQESLFRTMAFDARLRQGAAVAGVNPSAASLAMIEDAIRHVREITVSAAPKSETGRTLLRAMSLPIMTAMGHSFPRFMMNAWRFMYEFSPLPLFSPGTYRAMASADPIKAYSALNKVAIGSMMSAAGFAAEMKGMTGERPFEIKGENGKRHSLLYYQPITSPFLVGALTARYFQKGEDAWLSMDMQDWVQAALTLRRTDRTGIPIVDVVAGSGAKLTPKSVRRMIMDGIGQYASGFTVPLRTAGDFVAPFYDGERIPRYTKESPLIGPTMANIPGVKQLLPPASSPLRETPAPYEKGPLRQLTGLTSRRVTPVEVEADRLGLKPRSIYPNTGDKEVDRLIAKRMGPMVEKALSAVVVSEGYQRLPDGVKTKMVRDLLHDIRKSSERTARSVDVSSAKRLDMTEDELEKSVRRRTGLRINLSGDEN